ncbi:FecR domain-containing protein [Chitinophagaceae bacterium LB-8]|uniref:FecR domain-containing protein n=1 Tax=Paraflavisolibacter caeni TaxID=2982496 RepID=A0A9X2Y0V4_9BACT|nr:FecR family protein [Paraflavisolibacter caeni]MCU7552616.1 FecR domain-containing protein [Paraflavisolibacter caeni]
MNKDEHYYRDLLKRYLENSCTPTEIGEVLDFLEKDSSNRLLLLQLKEQFYNTANEKNQISNKQSGRIREALLKKITEAPVISINRRRWQFVAAAAAIIMMIGMGAFLIIFQKNAQKPEVVKTELKDKRFKNDVLPGGNKAVLTLADGSAIVLDDARNGALAQQGNTKVIKLGGKLAYDVANAGIKEVLYNTIATPRGGQYQVELPDGSQVWLNSASSLRFPTTFVGKERKVEINGEAYFEVAKNKSMPFIVSVNGAEVQVLGTHFNVMAYKEEFDVKTTLLEGSIRFVSGNNTSLLKPGQQAKLSKEGQVKVVNDVDVDEVIAWKNGMFNFEKVDIETVMRQLARWYDVEVVYQNEKGGDLFHVEIPRNTKLSDALKILEVAGGARFEIEGKRIKVLQ